jgi:hypothetical protein
VLAQTAAVTSPTHAFYAIDAVVLAWDLFVAGRIFNNRRGSPVFLGLTALSSLLVVPAVVVAVVASTVLNGRAVYIIDWLWPVVACLCALQALHALGRGTVAPFLGFPIAAYNVILFVGALARFLTAHMPEPPAPVMAFAVSHASVIAFVWGRSALTSPLALQVPVLSPSYPTPYRSGKVFRVALALWATTTLVLFTVEYPGALHAVTTFPAFAGDRLQERPRGDFMIGVRIFPELSGPPPRPAVLADLALVDSIGAQAVSVVIQPTGGVTAAALDSLTRTLEDRRRSGVRLLVALGYGVGDAERFRVDPEEYHRTRLAALDRVVRRLHPEVVFPALDPYLAGSAALGSVPPRWWRQYLRDAATLVHAARPATRVAVSASAFTPADSELFAWAASPTTTIDDVAIALYPSYDGGASIRSRMLVADRWLENVRKPAWVLGTGAYPRLFGERNQGASLWGMLAWATTLPRVGGFVADGAGDYDALTGLRAPGGRLRPATDVLARVRKILAEP